MTVWAATTVVTVADRHDLARDQAEAPFGTRFGCCLARHLDGLAEQNHGDPVAFAVWSWTVATAPLIRPGYVRVRPDLSAVRLTRSRDEGRLLVEVDIPVPHGQLAASARPPYEVRDWEPEGPHSRCAEPRRLKVPADESRPALLLSATLRLPASDGALHQPAGAWAREEELVEDAEQAVAVAAKHINRVAGRRIAALLGDNAGRW
ncbi:hypothetical protein [Streptomyces paromomycinus]|uniref:Uncharacterized protein n=1 Tax=Streptomyces paromomycinus TaxID=92743 RepID=A0A401VXZ2_STREY|nr:hypothetical protein [Streptomyces paromomycinus]GCD41929.1 hypothetical protein GKJPGBOP_01587 [Streptomyces paromomycinus]